MWPDGENVPVVFLWDRCLPAACRRSRYPFDGTSTDLGPCLSLPTIGIARSQPHPRAYTTMTFSLMDRLSASLGGGDRLSVTGVLLLAGLLVLPAQAQESIQFAPRIGASIATVRSDTAAKTRSKTSIMGGVALRVPLPGPLSLQPEQGHAQGD